MWLLILFFFSTGLIFAFYRKQKLNFWKNRHVVTLPDTHFLFGDIKHVLFAKENLAATMQRAYHIIKPLSVKYFGMYCLDRPIFVPIDPQLIRNIMVKDFDHFVDRGAQINFKNDILAANLFNLNGNEWKSLRSKLTSTFTSGKLKGMVDIIKSNIDNLVTKIDQELSMGNRELFLNNYFEQLGIDIIGQVAFGIDCNTLNGQNTDFYAMIQRIFHPTMVNLTKYLLSGGVTNPSNVIALTTSDKEMSQFFISLIKDTVNHRQMLKLQNSPVPKDFLQLLIEMHENDQITIDQLAAQTFVFFFAAFETSSKVVNFTMYELSKNLQLQKKLRSEIMENIKNFTYDEIMECKLLDLVYKESLRKHSTVVFIHRECAKPYRLSSDTILEPGQILLMPLLAIQRDEEYYPDPDVFEPLRFDENESPYKKVDPITYYPFGEGPRNCIGMRMAGLQVKLTIAKLVRNFEVCPSEKTTEPLEFKPVTDNLLLTYKNPIYFNVKRFF